MFTKNWSRRILLSLTIIVSVAFLTPSVHAAVSLADLERQVLQLQEALKQLQAKRAPKVLGISNVSYARTIYVDANLSGNCSGNYSIANRNCSGSNGDAYPTIGAAVKVLTPGTEIKVRAGTYRESISMPSGLGGTATNQIGISGYGSERPTLSGASVVSNIAAWQPCTAAACGNNPNWANMYYAKLPASMFSNVAMPQLMENGQKLAVASYPKLSDPSKEYTSDLWPVDAGSVGRSDGFTSTRLTESNGYWDGAEMRFWLHAANNYIVGQRVGTYSNGEVLFASPLSKAISKGSQIDAFMFVNSLKDKVMSKPGEYVFTRTPDANNEHTVYVWPTNKANLNSIEIAHRNVGIVFVPSYFNFSQFAVTAYNGDTSRSGGIAHPKGTARSNVTIDDVIFSNINAPSSAALNISSVDDLTVSNSKALNILADTRGFFSSSASRVKFLNNEVKVVGSSAMAFFTVVDGVMEGNYVSDYTSTHGNAYTCYINCKNVLIKNNRAYDTGRIMLAINDGIDMKIIGNVFDGNDNPELSSSFIAIRSGAQGTNYVLNNAFLRMPGDTAFSLANQAAGVTFVVKNNIIDGSTNQFNTAGVDASNNLWTGFAWNQTSSRGWTAKPTDKTETNLSKLFSQYNGSYSLAAGSPTIDAGFDTRAMVSSVAGVSAHTSLGGASRPLGAYDIGPLEAGSGTVPPPTTPAPTLTISAAPTSITSGSSATLTWTATNATTCTASGAWTGSKSTSGSQSTGALSTTGTQTFTLTCTGAGGSVTQSTNVSVTATTPTTPAPTVTLTAAPTTLTTSNSATLTWSSTNATSCTASGAWTGTKTTSGTGSTGALTTTGTKTFTLTCIGAGGSGTATAVVTVTAPTITDTDKDGVADTTDNCSLIANATQANYDGDTQGDACDSDDDNDGILDTNEKSGCTLNPATTCGAVPPVTSVFTAGTRIQTKDIVNVRSTNMATVLGTQPVGSVGTVQTGTPIASNGYTYIPVNFDSGIDGMVADEFLATYTPPTITDTDKDGVADTTDNCSLIANATQANYDGDTQGDACDSDDDNDGILDTNEKSGCALNPATTCGTTTGGGSGGGSGGSGDETPAPTLTLSATPNPLLAGSKAVVSWSTTDAKKCSASGNWSGTKSTRGSFSETFTTNQTFTLTCTGTGGTVTQTVTVVVNGTGTSGDGEPTEPVKPTTGNKRVVATDNLNVRSTANGEKIGVQPKGAKGTQTGTTVAAGEYTWTYVNFDAAADGYVVTNYLTNETTTVAPTVISPTTVSTQPSTQLLTEAERQAKMAELLKQITKLQALLAALKSTN
ncbi:MAG: hypothetical protein RLZZ360_555 [Candidatus Parcubacteria bacterium]|jgi:hypothetical protein